jgi:hypothetical protein
LTIVMSKKSSSICGRCSKGSLLVSYPPWNLLDVLHTSVSFIYIDVLTIFSHHRVGLRNKKNYGQNHLVVRNEAHCCLQSWTVVKTSRFSNAPQVSLSATDYSNKDKRQNRMHLPVLESNYKSYLFCSIF